MDYVWKVRSSQWSLPYKACELANTTVHLLVEGYFQITSYKALTKLICIEGGEYINSNKY